MRFNSLQQWLSWLETLHPKSIDLGLERIRLVAENLNLLPVKKPVITVAGTNGKGSCVAFCDAILTSAGYRVGTYTSPHLYYFNERIKIADRNASDDEICWALEKVDFARGDITLTYFEFTTLAALIIFQEADLDAIILEVGLGGRLDAVNIVDPEISIISTIDFDHTEWLGDTREKIGFEKAGIMRKDKITICGDEATPDSIKNYAHEIYAKLYCYGEDYFYQQNISNWSWWNGQLKFNDLPLTQLPIQNAATVIQALQFFSLPVTDTAIYHGLKQAKLPGRFQVIDATSSPAKIILDVAHNPASARLLAKNLENNFYEGKTVAIVGMLKDKDIKNTLSPLVNQIDHWYLATLNGPRGANARDLADILSSLGQANLSLFNTVTEAYAAAQKNVQVTDKIVIFGSFLTVGQLNF